YYVGNIVNDISGITRKSTDKNLIGEVDFLICRAAVNPFPGVCDGGDGDGGDGLATVATG
ncbi:MAG: hypothetical protein ACI4SU_08315, partial [Anaerovoracaceae bacterium]